MKQAYREMNGDVATVAAHETAMRTPANLTFSGGYACHVVELVPPSVRLQLHSGTKGCI